MAVSSPPVSLGHGVDTAPTGRNISMASITFTAGKLYVFATEDDNGQVGPATDMLTGTVFLHGATDRSASWHSAGTPLTFGTGSPTPRMLGVWWYIPTVTETVTFQVTFVQTNCTVKFWSLIEVTSGFHATTPVLQYKSGTGAGVSTLSVTMDAAPQSGSLMMSWWASRAASSANSAERANWTELTEDLGTGTSTQSGGLEIQYTTTSDQTGSVNFPGSRTIGGIVIEIQPVAAGGGAQTLDPTSTVASGGWSVSGAATHHAALADDVGTSYVQSPANPVGEVLKLGLTDISPPGTGDVIFEIDAEQV